MTMRRIRGTGFLLAGVLLAGSAAAHDYWFEPDAEGDGIVLLRGHRYSQHEGNEIEPYLPSMVQGATCTDGSDAARAIAVAPVYPLTLPENCAGLHIVVDSGVWAVASDGTIHAQLADDVAAPDSWKSLETIKLIRAWDARLAQPISQELELVPTEDPFALEPGDKIRLLVSLQGKPVEGALVAYDGDLRGVTDAEGYINIRIRHPGLQVIMASVEEDYAGSEAESLIRTATLEFELP